MNFNKEEASVDQEIDNDLPADEGKKAYQNRLHHNSNPYNEDKWQHNEWWLGWSMAEECDGYSFDWSKDCFKC